MKMQSESKPAALLSALSGMKPGFERIGREACSLAAWLDQGLGAAGLPAICIEPRHAKAASEVRIRVRLSRRHSGREQL